MVISHLLMYREIPFLRNSQTFLWSYYDKSGKEIDAILKENERYCAIEVKYRMQVDEREIKRISPVKRYIMLSKEDTWLKGETLIIPLDVFLAFIPSSERNV